MKVRVAFAKGCLDRGDAVDEPGILKTGLLHDCAPDGVHFLGADGSCLLAPDIFDTPDLDLHPPGRAVDRGLDRVANRAVARRADAAGVRLQRQRSSERPRSVFPTFRWDFPTSRNPHLFEWTNRAGGPHEMCGRIAIEQTSWQAYVAARREETAMRFIARGKAGASAPASYRPAAGGTAHKGRVNGMSAGATPGS
jgi:hypothetical protein